MLKLIVFVAMLAVAAAAPKPGHVIAYSAPVVVPVVSPVVAPVVTSVVSPAVSSYSAYSNSVVHGSPVVPVHHAVVHQPLVHSVPLTYSAHVPLWVR